MKVSQLFAQTLRETPNDATLPSHQLLLRGGYIKPLSTGIYSIFPLGKRVLRKIEGIIREEMDKIDGQELELPLIQPSEIWKESGRYDVIGSELLRFQDRNDHDMVLAMTHEEAVTDLVRSCVNSYKQLPFMTYQFQTKYRDEARARGGLIRVREFVMKDAYSFHADETDLEEYYQKAYVAYEKIFNRAGIKPIIVQSDTGIMGGKVAHEYMLETPHGEDYLIICRECGYQANAEIADFKREDLTSDLKTLEKVSTPHVTSIEDVSAFLNLKTKDTMKSVFYRDIDKKLFCVLVRGDLEVSEIKLKNYLKINELFVAEPELIEAQGFVVGFTGPVSIAQKSTVRIIVDTSIQSASNLVSGANENNFHYINTNLGRDFDTKEIVDVAQANSGCPCPKCEAPLEATRGIEVGNIFQLGTKFSESMGAHFLDSQGRRQAIIMGCYGIGVGRLMASIAEEHHDENGIIWPKEVAPYQIHIVTLGKDEDSIKASQEIYDQLTQAGLEVLWDDRNERPGVKFKDADLWGCPVRLGVGGKGLKEGLGEWKLRATQGFEKIPMNELAEKAIAFWK